MTAPLELRDEHLRVVVDPARGGEIRFAGRPEGENVLAEAAWAAPLPASRSVSYGDDELDWKSEYRGGWQELFPNAGAACVVDGVPLPFHGEASTAGWEVVEAGAREATLRTAARLPVVLERRMRLAGDRPALLLEERVVNESPEPVDLLWGHHPTLPARPGMVVDAPPCTVRADDGFRPAALDVEPGATGRWPQVGAVDVSVVPEGPVERYCFLCDLPAGWAAVRDPAAGTGVALAWDAEVWPHAWLWLELGGAGFPWFGRGALLAIEPQRAWPGDGLAAARGRGRSLRLDGGASADAWLSFALFDADRRPVRGVERDGSVQRDDEEDAA